MANFPIVQSDARLSGRGTGVFIPQSAINRSGEIVGDALVQLGNMGKDEARQWNNLNASNEQSQAQYQTQERLLRLQEDVDNEPDPTKYPELYNSALSDIQTFRPKGKLGARLFDMWYRKNKPEWDSAVSSSIQNRIDKTDKENVELMRGSFIGQVQTASMHLVLEKGAAEALKWASDPNTIASAESQNVSAAELLTAARLGISMADSVRAEAEANLRKEKQAQEVEQEKTQQQFQLLLSNLQDPSQPQLTVADIDKSNLTSAQKEHYKLILRNWTKELFDDNGQVLAEVLQRQQQGQIKSQDIWSRVGHGLSPRTAASLTDPDSFYSDWGFKSIDAFLKGNLRYNELAGWEHPEGQLAYTLAMKDLRDVIARSDPPLRGEKSFQAGVQIAIPYLRDYWKNVMSSGVDEQAQQALIQQLRRISGQDVSQTQKAQDKPDTPPPAMPAPAAPPANKNQTNEDKWNQIRKEASLW